MRVKFGFGIVSAITRLALTLVPVKKGVVFVTLHHIEDSELEWVSSILDQLSLSCDFIDPKEIENSEFILKRSSRTKIVLTFDDAFKCQKTIADKCLSSRNIKALFFVPSAFVGLDGNEALEFTKENFFPNSKPRELPEGGYDAMTWNDLNSLILSGHTIGGHSENHPQLSKLSKAVLEDEILKSADLLEIKLKVKINHFAYPFGSLKTISQSSYSVVKDRFDWAYSNIRGMFDESPSRHFVYRQNLVPGMPLWLVKAIVEGRLDWKYRRDQKQAESLFTQKF